MTTITHPHIATRITSYLQRNPYATTADIHRDIHRKHNRITTTLDDLRHANLIQQHPNHGWTLTNSGQALADIEALTPDTPTTPTPTTIADGNVVGFEYWLAVPEHGMVGSGPTEDLRAVEQDADAWADVGKAGQIMRRPVGDWEPLEDTPEAAASFEGENRATPSPARVVDAIAASIGKRVGHDPETGDPRLEDAPHCRCGHTKADHSGDRAEDFACLAYANSPSEDCPCSGYRSCDGTDQHDNGHVHTYRSDPSPSVRWTVAGMPQFDVAKAVVDELEARMRDRLRAWGLQCENTSSDQETQP